MNWFLHSSVISASHTHCTHLCISGCPECPCLSVCFSKCVGCHWSWVKRSFNPLVLWCCLLGERKAIVSVQRHFSRLSVISLSAYRPAGVTTCCSDCISHISLICLLAVLLFSICRLLCQEIFLYHLIIQVAVRPVYTALISWHQGSLPSHTWHSLKVPQFFSLNSRPWKYLKTGLVLEFEFLGPWKSWIFLACNAVIFDGIVSV